MAVAGGLLLPLATLAGCNGLIALDGYHTCTDAPTECADASGADAGDGASDTGSDVTPTSCTSSSGCSGSTPICSAGRCTSAKMLAQGSSIFSCVVLADGHVMCWGQNDEGQLGTGNFTASATPTPVVGLSDVAEVALAFSSACARKNDGTVWCWGKDDGGILGTPKVGNQTSPIKVPLGAKAKSIAVGPGIGCAVFADDTVTCWGRNSSGAVDLTSDAGELPPKALPVSNAVSAHVSGYGVCVLHDGASLTCWGNDDVGLFAIPQNQIQHKGFVTATASLGSSPKELRMGEIHACAVFAGDTVQCWGDDECNVVSAGSTTGNCNNTFSNVVPTPKATVPFLQVAHASPQYVDTCVLQTNGRVRCWGRNEHGSLGTNTTPSGDPYGAPSADVQLLDGGALENVVEMATHRQFACALTADSALYCWGQNLGSASIGPPGGDRPYASRVAWP